MAKDGTDKKKKKKTKTIVKIVYRKKPAAAKSGGLPKSVKALLGYLGKSDTALSGSSQPARAQLAPQVQQQQQQQQQQQNHHQALMQPVFRTRAAQGTVIGKSPLAVIQAAAPPPQSIVIKTTNAAPAKQKDEKATAEIGALVSRVSSIEDIARQTIGSLKSSIKRIDRRVSQFEQDDWTDASQTPALSQTAKRPIIRETRFGSAISLGDIRPEIMSATPARRLSFHGVDFADDEAEDVSDFIAGQHLQNVTNPQIQPIEKAKRGRKPGTKLTPNTLESFRTKRTATLLAKKGAASASAAAAEQAALYAQVENLNSASLLESASKIKTKRQVTPKKRADINDALSASANIELLVAGGGAAAADDGLQPQQTRTPVPPSANASASLASRATLTSRRMGGGAAKKGGGGDV